MLMYHFQLDQGNIITIILLYNCFKSIMLIIMMYIVLVSLSETVLDRILHWMKHVLSLVQSSTSK